MSTWRKLPKWLLPPPAGVAVGWATMATANAPAPTAWTFAAVGEWLAMPTSWAFIILGAMAGAGSFLGLRAWLDDKPAPPPATAEQVMALAYQATGGRRDIVAKLDSHGRELTEAKRGIEEIRRFLAGPVAEQALVAIRNNAVSTTDCERLYEALKERLAIETKARPALLQKFIGTASALAKSNDNIMRNYAICLVNQDPVKVADRIMKRFIDGVKASGGRGLFTARSGDYARFELVHHAAAIYAPFSLEKAIRAYRRALALLDKYHEKYHRSFAQLPASLLDEVKAIHRQIAILESPDGRPDANSPSPLWEWPRFRS